MPKDEPLWILTQLGLHDARPSSRGEAYIPSGSKRKLVYDRTPAGKQGNAGHVYPPTPKQTEEEAQHA